MSAVAAFFKKNKVARPNVKRVVSRFLPGAEGGPLEWELRPISTRENEALREAHTSYVTERGGVTLPRFDQKGYTAAMVAACVVVPDLHNAALQDSYGVKTPEDLLYELVDDPGEFTALSALCMEINGFDIGMDEKADEIKN